MGIKMYDTNWKKVHNFFKLQALKSLKLHAIHVIDTQQKGHLFFPFADALIFFYPPSIFPFLLF